MSEFEEIQVGDNVARLISIEGTAKGISFYLIGKPTFTIGSSYQCDITIPHECILPEHAKIEVDEDSYVLTDLSNGKTFVNGEKIDFYVLQEGDHIRISFDILVFNFRKVTEENLEIIQKDIERFRTFQYNPSEDHCATLKVLEGVNQNVIYPLKNKNVFFIGRGSNCDIKIIDSKISRVHCKIEIEDGEYILFDQNSTNGVFVRGEQKDIHPLEDGDHIKIGFTILEFRLPPTPNPTPNPDLNS